MGDAENPFPDAPQLIGRVELAVYAERLAMRKGIGRLYDMGHKNADELWEMFKLAVLVICTMADVHQMSDADMELMFASMKEAEKRSR